MSVDCSRKDPRQGELDHGRGEEEVHIREHWGLSVPQTGVGEVYESTECPSSLEPRFNLLIVLINHSRSSYPLGDPRIRFLPSSGSRGIAGKSPLLWPHNRLDKSLAAGETLVGLCCQQPPPITSLSFPLLPQMHIWGLPNCHPTPLPEGSCTAGKAGRREPPESPTLPTDTHWLWRAKGDKCNTDDA